MIGSIQTAKYDKEIKIIRKNRKSALVYLICALTLIVIFSFPLNIDLGSLVSIHTGGIGIGLSILLTALCLIIYVISRAVINYPLISSMDKECDPEKYIALNLAFKNGERLDGICASGLIYLGDYDEALPYAKSLIESNNKSSVLSGYFNIFRCEYFKGEYDKAKITAERYAEVLKNGKKMNSSVYSAYVKTHTVIKFMIALADKDTATQSDLLYTLMPWKPSQSVTGLVEYLKGVSAFDSGDMEEALFRFKWVIESCGKTVLAAYSREYLANLTVKTKDE